MDLLERAAKYVDRMPAAVSGSGGHDATFHVACVLVQGFGLSPEQAWGIMQSFNARCMPPWSDKELRHKLNGAERANGRRARGWLVKGEDTFRPSQAYRDYHSLPEPEKRPDFDAEKLAAFAGDLASEVDLVWLANRSSVDPATVTAGDFLRMMFAPGEKVAIFTRFTATTIGRGVEMWPDVAEIPREGDAKRPCGVWFLNQPVDGKYHPTDQEGKMSCRNHRAVTAWRYLLIESDKAPPRLWLGAIARLPLRLAALYTSGGRSIHALIRIDARGKADFDAERAKMERPFAVLGADTNAWKAVNLTRLPGCIRHGKMIDEKRADGSKFSRYERFPRPLPQKLLYVNPCPDVAPLVDILPRRDVVKTWCGHAVAGVSDSDESGGEWIRAGLEYYAPVSEAARVMLRGFNGGGVE